MASCPACHSTNARKLSVVYEEGLSTVELSSSSKTVGAGISSSAIGAGVAKTQGATTGVQQTALSKKASPPPSSPLMLPTMPSKPGELAMALGFYFGLSSLLVWLFWSFLYAYIALVAGSLVYFAGRRRNKNMTVAEHAEYEQLRQQWVIDCDKAKKNYELKNPLEIWKRSYMCMACGHQFDPTK